VEGGQEPRRHDHHLGTKTEQLLRNYGDHVLQVSRREGGRPAGVPRLLDDESEQTREARVAALAEDRASQHELVARLGTRGNLPIPREPVSTAPPTLTPAVRHQLYADMHRNLMPPRIDSYLNHQPPALPPHRSRRNGFCKKCKKPRLGHPRSVCRPVAGPQESKASEDSDEEEEEEGGEYVQEGDVE
jgi:hypothetical protein